VRAVRRALDVFPEQRDAHDWRFLAERAAMSLTMAGEPDTALDLLERLLTTPSQLTTRLLRLHPAWDDLRGRPRFDALLGMEDAVG
jgi:hypothetical protein